MKILFGIATTKVENPTTPIMKKIKQVSLGIGRASAFPFFICALDAPRATHPLFYLGSQKCRESQTCLFFLLLAILCKNPLSWSCKREATHGEARGSSDRMKTQNGGNSQTASCLQPLLGVDYLRESDKILYNNYERKKYGKQN